MTSELSTDRFRGLSSGDRPRSTFHILRTMTRTDNIRPVCVVYVPPSSPTIRGRKHAYSYYCPIRHISSHGLGIKSLVARLSLAGDPLQARLGTQLNQSVSVVGSSPKKPRLILLKTGTRSRGLGTPHLCAPTHPAR